MYFPLRIAGTVLALALLGGCSTPTPAKPLQTVSKTLTSTPAVPNGAGISVENMLGDVRISQGGAQLQVTATVVAGGADQAAAQALADSIHLSVKNDADQVRIHVDYPVDAHDEYRYQSTQPRASSDNGFTLLGIHINGNFSSNSSFTYQGKSVRVLQGDSTRGVPLQVNLAIQLPTGVRASIDNHVGTIDADNLANALELHGSSGNISTQHITGNLRIETGSGDAVIAHHAGNVTVRTGSGDLTLREVTGNLDLHTGSGDINATTLRADTIAMQAGSGDLILHQATGDLDLHTGSGDITGDALRANAIVVQAGSGDIKLDDVSGGLKLHTGSGDIALGHIVNAARADIGSGSGDIKLSGDLSAMRAFDISAGSGDITLATSKPPAVHLDIESPDIHANWTGINNAKTSERAFSGDIGAAAATGSIRSASGSVTLTPQAN